MSTPLSEHIELLEKLFGDGGKQNTHGKEFLASSALITLSKLSSVANDKPFILVTSIQDLGKKMISLISSNPTLFCAGFAVGVTVGVAVPIFLSKSKIFRIVSDYFKNSSCENVFNNVSSFFLSNKTSIETFISVKTDFPSVSSNPASFCIGLVIGVAVGVVIYCSLNEESKSKIISNVPNCFKNASCLLKICWKKACSYVSSLFSSNKALTLKNETTNVATHTDSQEVEIHSLNSPVKGIDSQIAENTITEKIRVCRLFLRLFKKLAIEKYK
ncbi:hypothetical protein ACTFIR_004385 [Dictyostelium discoideum]